MKYIRTKDGRVESWNPNNKDLDMVEYLSQFANYQGDYAVIAQADTIEELCDEFVYKNGCGSKKGMPMVSKNDFNSLKEWFLGNGYKVNTIYGAIWTDKGLKYIAKMNSKGELELI